MRRGALLAAALLGVLVALVAAGLVSYSRRSPMSTSFAPTVGDLEEAYGRPDPNLAGHQEAEAVVVGAEGITVLCTADPTGSGRHTWLLQLAHDGNERWRRHYPAGAGAGGALVAAPGGGFVIAGEVQRGPMAYQGHLLRVAADGSIVSQNAFGPEGGTSFAAVAGLPDGSVVAAGASGWKGWVLWADAALKARTERPIDGTDEVHGIAPLPDGTVAIAATAEASTTGLGRTGLLALGEGGDVRWQRRLPATGRGEPGALVPVPGGGLALVGHHVADDPEATRMWVARLGAAGEPGWERMLGPADEERRGRAIAVSADGSIAVAGDALKAGRRGVRVARLEPDGTPLWERAYGGEGSDLARGLAWTADGGLVVVGSTTRGGSGKANVWILRLGGDGALLWDRVLAMAEAAVP